MISRALFFSKPYFAGFTVELGAGCLHDFCDYSSNTEIFTFFLSPPPTGFQLRKLCVRQVTLEADTPCQNELFLAAVCCLVKHKEKRKSGLESEKSRSPKPGLQEPLFRGGAIPTLCDGFSGALSALTWDTLIQCPVIGVLWFGVFIRKIFEMFWMQELSIC